MTTILEKCGITKEMVEFLKRRGLVVPEKVEPTTNPLRSPSEDWFYFIADRFTPPLNPTENEAFRKIPYLFTLKMLEMMHVAINTSSVLYEALQKVKTNLVRAEEKVAALLAILRIFHGCLDYNILKYDRHLEYHDYEESPVGHFWKKFRQILLKAAPDVEDKEEWVNQKSLEILSGRRRLHFAGEYYLACSEAYKILKKEIPNVDSWTKDKVIEEIKKYPIAFEIIKEFSAGFYRLPEEFINDALLWKDRDLQVRAIENKRRARKILDEICSRLSEEETNDLERIVEILDEFSAIQELEGAFGVGVHRGIKNKFFDVLIEGYNELKTLLEANVDLVRPEFKKEVSLLLKGKDAPSIFIADREFVFRMDEFFKEEIGKLCLSEIERWL